MYKSISIATLIALVCAAPFAHANHEFEDYARVINVTPQYEEVNLPRKECTSEYVPERTYRRGSLAGPIIGGIAGGVLGAQVGKGNGRVAASAAGAAIGAIVGNRLSNREREDYYEREVTQCEMVDHWESRLTGYRVEYRYQGRTHTALLPYDPGRRIRLRVSVEPVGPGQISGGQWDR